MLIDATHPEETRVVVVNGNRLEEFDYETTTKKQIKGNVYLAKVTRVEPSLQAAFVEYGGNRHGFLAFSEIHPDYYRIPVGDREELVEEEPASSHDDDDEADESGDGVEDMGAGEGVDEAVEEAALRRPRLRLPLRASPRQTSSPPSTPLQPGDNQQGDKQEMYNKIFLRISASFIQRKLKYF